MDFQSFTRRELQSLCKKNKIPANMTNVAMADALKSLEIVEGIEELSETAQSSIESPARSEVTSPYVPPTGGRSTRRRNLAKEEPETVKPMTRTPRMARKAPVKEADESEANAIETPAVPRTNRKKVQMASACRKMDSQLKECVDEENKNVLVTPAPSGVTSRRRVLKEESTVKRVYSTRRSARLAQKNMVLLHEKENENSGIFKKDLSAKAGNQNVEMNLKEILDNSDETSGITGINGSATMEENSEKKDEVEVVSAVGDETRNHFEADGSKPDLKEGNDVEIREVVALDEQKCDKTEDSKDNDGLMPLTLGNEVQESDGRELKELDKTEDPKDESIFVPLNVSYEVQESDGRELKELDETEDDKDESTVISLNVSNEVDENDGPDSVFSRDVVALDEEKCDKTEDSRDYSTLLPLNLGNEVQESDGREQKELDKTEDPKDESIFVPLNVSYEVQESDGPQQRPDETEDAKDESIDISLNVSNDVDENDGPDGSHEFCASEIEINMEDLNAAEDAGCEDEAVNCVEPDLPDAETTMEENSEKKVELEVILAPKQDTSIFSVCSIDEEMGNHFEADGYKTEVEEGGDVEIQEVGFGFETEAALDEQKFDNAFSLCSTEEEMGNQYEAGGYKTEVEEGGDVEIQEVGFGFETEAALDEQKFDDTVSVCSIEEEKGNQYDADGYKTEVEEVSDVEIQEVGFGIETEAELDEQKFANAEDPKDENIVMPLNINNEVQESDGDETEAALCEQERDKKEDPKDDSIVIPLNSNNEVQASHGSHDIHASEVEISVDNTEVLNSDKDTGYENEPADFMEDVALISEDTFGVDEISCDTDIPNEIEKGMYNDKGTDAEAVTEFNMNKEVLEIKSELNIGAGEIILNPDEPTDVVILEAKDEPSNAINQTTDDSLAEAFNISLTNEENEAKMKLNVSDWNAVVAKLSEKWDSIGVENETNMVKHTELELQKDTEAVLPVEEYGEIEIAQHKKVIRTICLTPIKSSASNASATKKRMPVVSDNKENIGSGGKLVLAKERAVIVKNADDKVTKMNDISIRKLSKMLKEKLQITKKSTEDENDNEAPARPALQALPENR